MKWLRGLNLAQRLVVVVALGIGLAAVGSYIQTTQTAGSGAYGWFGYAPLTRAIAYAHGGLTPGEMLWIWLGLIAAWTVVSVVLLHKRPSRERGD